MMQGIQTRPSRTAISLNKVHWLRGTLYIQFKNAEEARNTARQMNNRPFGDNGRILQAVQLRVTSMPNCFSGEGSKVEKGKKAKAMKIGGKKGKKLAWGGKDKLYLHRLPKIQWED